MTSHWPLWIASDARGKHILLDLASEAAHVLVQGQTRSGKSALVTRLIASAIKFPFAAIAGADPSGVLLHPLRDFPFREWRSAAVGDIQSHAAALQALVAELDRRLFLLLESETDKILDFTQEIPLVIVVLEEFPGLVSAAEDDDATSARRPTDRLAPLIRRNVSRLVRESAKVGFRLVCVTQRADAAVIGGNDRSNYGTRITLRVDNPDAVRMLHPYCPNELAETAYRFPAGTGLLQTPSQPLQRVSVPPFTYAQYISAARTYIQAGGE